MRVNKLWHKFSFWMLLNCLVFLTLKLCSFAYFTWHTDKTTIQFNTKKRNTFPKIIQETSCRKSSDSNRSLILLCPVHFVTLTLLYSQQKTLKNHPNSLLISFSPVKWTLMHNKSFRLMCHWVAVQFCSLHSMLQWGACFCKGHIILRLTGAHSDCQLESGVVIFCGFFLM